MKSERKNRHWLFILILLVGSLAFIVQPARPIFFFNHTKSMPIGLYKIEPNKDLSLGDIIIFNVSFYQGNLIKHVAALAPLEFCEDEEGVLWIDGIPKAQKNIQKWHGTFLTQSICQTLQTNELLVLGQHPDSLDSRYFGVIRKENVIAKVKPIWAW